MTICVAVLATPCRAIGISVGLAPPHASFGDGAVNPVAAALIVLALVALIVRGRGGSGTR